MAKTISTWRLSYWDLRYDLIYDSLFRGKQRGKANFAIEDS